MAFFVSGLFYLVAFICILVGVYLLYINMNTILNKIAFLFCTSLGCWCYGAARSLIASDSVDSLLWRRFGAIGVGTFYSFFLHYIIILTKNDKLIKKAWMKVLLYIPSFVTVYFFALSDQVTHKLYHLEKTAIGWISRSNFSLWTVYFDVYIISFLLIGLFMVYKWRINSKEKHEKKQADIILISYLISFVVAILVEFLDNFGNQVYFQEFSPLILVLPMISVCYAIRKYNFMKAIIINDDKIFMEQFRTKISKYLAGAFCMGGVIYFFSQYMKDSQAAFRSVITFSILLFLFGFSIYYIQKYIINKECRIMCFSFLLSLAIPVISLYFIEYAAVTVWAFPFIIIIATLLFNNSTILTMVSTSMILTQLFIWIKVQNCVVAIKSDDYFARIGFMEMGYF